MMDISKFWIYGLALVVCTGACGTAELPRRSPRIEPDRPLRRLIIPDDTRDRCSAVLPVARVASRLYQIEVHLILAIIKIESNFNPRAVSRVGARGLMQLMPRTARGNGIEDPFDPQQNVMGGTLVLRKFIDYYEGDVMYGLAAYNAGYVSTNRARRARLAPRNYSSYVRKVLSARNHIAKYGCKW